jgi:hypothetical protein
MPRASWDHVIELLKDRAEIDWPRDPNTFIMALVKEIDDQVYSQEY